MSLNRLKKNLSENKNGEIIYKEEVILSHVCGRRDNLDHKIKVYFNSFTVKFDEIILETQIQLRKRFGDFEALPLKNLCELFDFKLWPKSFHENKKWGFDILQELVNYYKNYDYITEEEGERCVRQWPLFRSRVSRLRVENVYDVYVDMLQENGNDMDCMLILLKLMMTISSSTCACERGFSCMNMQKTNTKISMSNDTLNDIIVISVNGPSITEFDAIQAVDNWIASGKRRLETGHKTGQSRKRKANELSN